METKPFVASVLLAATAFLAGCGQVESDCVNGKHPDGTPCNQNTGSSVHSSTPVVVPSRSSDETTSKSNAVTSESKGTVGGFGDAHAGVAGEGGVGG